MLRTARILIPLLLASIVMGCSPGQPYDATLLNAERVMSISPDSACDMIISLEHCDTLSQGNRALFSVLYIEAVHKKRLTIDDTTAITASEHYFKRHGDELRWGKAVLQHGIILLNANKFTQAAWLMKQAEEIAHRQHNKELTYDAAHALGDLNRATQGHNFMLKNYRKALETAQLMHNPSLEAMSLYKLIRAYAQEGKADSAQMWVNEAIPVAKTLEPLKKADLMASMAHVKLLQGDNFKAKAVLQDALNTFPSEYAALLMGNVLEQEGDMEQAVKYWYQANNTLDAEIKMEALKSLIAHYKDKNPERTLNLSITLNNVYTEIHIPGQTEKVAEIQTEHDQMVKNATSSKRLKLIGGIAAGLTLLVLTLLVYHRQKMHRYSALMSHLGELQRQIATQERQKEWQSEEELMNREIVHKFHQLATAGKTPQLAQWALLHDEVDCALPGFLQIINQNGTLPERDLRMCMLIKLCFLPTEIAVLTGVSPQIVTNSRARLLNRIFGESGGARDFDKKIQSLNRQ